MAFAAYRVRPDRTYDTGVWYPYPIKAHTPPALASDTLWRFLTAFGPQSPVVSAQLNGGFGYANPGASIVAAAQQAPRQMVQRAPSVGAGVTARVINATAAHEPYFPQTTAWFAQQRAMNRGTFFDQVLAKRRMLSYMRR